MWFQKKKPDGPRDIGTNEYFISSIGELKSRMLEIEREMPRLQTELRSLRGAINRKLGGYSDAGPSNDVRLSPEEENFINLLPPAEKADIMQRIKNLE